jgi:alpha-L-fucosidase 2
MNHRLLCLCVLGAVTAFAAPTFQTDREYGVAAGESLRLDACVPDGRGTFAAVILVHGGAWTAGDKSGGPGKALIAPMHEPLTQAGFAWFSINYRLAPKHRYPACIEDVETAIRWVKAHAAEFRVDPKRIALSGESAGGHLVALAAVRANEDTRVAAVVPFYGPFDLVSRVEPDGKLSPVMQALFGRETFDATTEALMHAASPVLNVRSGLPPFLLVHGTADTRVPFQQSVDLHAALGRVGVPCELISIPGGNHGMKGWATLKSDYQAQIIAWLRRTLGAMTKS